MTCLIQGFSSQGWIHWEVWRCRRFAQRCGQASAFGSAQAWRKHGTLTLRNIDLSEHVVIVDPSVNHDVPFKHVNFWESTLYVQLQHSLFCSFHPKIERKGPFFSVDLSFSLELFWCDPNKWSATRLSTFLRMGLVLETSGLRFLRSFWIWMPC